MNDNKNLTNNTDLNRDMNENINLNNTEESKNENILNKPDLSSKMQTNSIKNILKADKIELKRNTVLVTGSALILLAIMNCSYITKLNANNNQLNEDIVNLNKIINNKDNTISSKNKNIDDLNKLIEEYKEKESELNNKISDAEPWFKMGKLEQERIRQENIAKEEEARKKEEEAERKAEEERLAQEKAELEAKTKTFGTGHYTAGEDFDSGTYDIIWVSGYGNVSGGNIFGGGINEIMGDNPYFPGEKEVKNITFKYGETLSLSGGVKVKLVPKY